MRCARFRFRDGKLKLLPSKMVMGRFVRACEITVSAFHEKRARGCLNNFSPQRRTDWEWGWRSSVPSLNRTEVQLMRRMLTTAERAFPSSCRQARKLQND